MFRRHRQSFRKAWDRVWFEYTPTTMLDIARVGIGAAMLIHYSLATPFLLVFWGDEGLISRTQILEDLEPWAHSVHLYLSAPWQWMAFHAVFLFSCAALMAGFRTTWVKWIVLIGQISYAYRNPIIVYGVDRILASLLLILCIAPIGRAISFDRVRDVRAAKRRNLQADLPRYSSPRAGACTRLMQIQMAVLFFYSGIGKIRGDEWWDGDAMWEVFATHEFYSDLMLQILARHYWLGNIASYATMLIEISFPFLIWPRRTRPYALAAAIFLHSQFALLMGLFYFSFVMVMGHMSFLRPVWLDRLGTIWKRRMGDMEMIYDGRCGFCVRSMAWFLAFDGLKQVRTRDFRTCPSPIVADAQLEEALYLVLPDGRALRGFEAYRFVVLRVPGMWWMIPFFYLPVFSRLVGNPIYRWVAANRSWQPPRSAAAASD